MKLIIADKKSAAQSIASVIGADSTGKGYFFNTEYMVSWCKGYLVGLAEPVAYGARFKERTLDTLPILPTSFRTEVADYGESQFAILKELMHREEISEIIEATDAGREGELMFRSVYEKAGCQKPFLRLWINSMEEEEIRRGLANLKPGSEYDSIYEAALCRQKADWLVGMNFSRLYSLMYHTKLSCGRVQTPTLKLIADRVKQIREFNAEKYFSLSVSFPGFQAFSNVDNFETAEKIMMACMGKEAAVSSVKTEKIKKQPPKLFDLTSLQREANRVLGYTAQQTLEYTRSLYEKRLATYPTTESNYITADMERPTMELIVHLLDTGVISLKEEPLLKQDIATEQIVSNTSAAHHSALLPTMKVTPDILKSLPTGERNILLLIASRLLAAVSPVCEVEKTRVIFDIEGYPFTTTQERITQPGYSLIENSLFDDLASSKPAQSAPQLPTLGEGNSFVALNIEVEEKSTLPPDYLTDDTLLQAMETAGQTIANDNLREAIVNRGIGTASTRANIIENIISSGYVERIGKNLLVTEKGRNLLSVVTADLQSPELTASWEKSLSDIESGAKSGEQFIAELTEFIKEFIDTTKLFLNPELIENPFSLPSLGICPCCQKNNVVEMDRSYSCEGWQEGCRFTVWKEINQKPISRSQVEKLVATGRTDYIKGFISKSGKRYNAALYVKSDKTIGFDFTEPITKQKTKSSKKEER